MCKSTGSAQQDLPQLLESALNEHCNEMKDMYFSFQNEMYSSLVGINAKEKCLENIISCKVLVANVDKIINLVIVDRLQIEV